MTTASIGPSAVAVQAPGSLAGALRRVGQAVTAALVLAVAAAAAVAGLSLARGAWMVTPVLSGSMRPGLAVGGAVISERVPVSRLVPRDVIVFTNPDHPGELMVHRIVSLTRRPSGEVLIRTRGDANPVRDPWTLAVRGRSAYLVRWSVPMLGYLAVAFQNERGFFLQFAGLLLVLFAASTYLASLVRREEVRPQPAGATTARR